MFAPFHFVAFLPLQAYFQLVGITMLTASCRRGCEDRGEVMRRGGGGQMLESETGERDRRQQKFRDGGERRETHGELRQRRGGGGL